jgi:putative DNA primase/helicase
MSAFDSFANEQRWIAWRNENRGGKLTKVPYGVGGKPAKANDPATWLFLGDANALEKRIANGHGGGVGLELGDLGSDLSIDGADLDSCIDANGAIAPWAKTILDALDTYAEVSPSGAGIKAFFYIANENVRPFLELLGVAPDQWGTKRSVGEDGRDHGPGVEIYCAHRYFAVTNKLLPGKPTQINCLDWSQLKQFARLLPPRREPNGHDHKQKLQNGGRDNSRSAKAFREGAKLRRAGASFEEMCSALRQHTDPDIPAWVRETGLRGLQRIWDKTAPTPVVPFSEDALALRFTQQHRDDLRFLATLNKWYRWSCGMWCREETLEAFDLARAVCRSAAAEPQAPGREISKAKTVAAVVNLARADRNHATTHDQWDADPWLLNPQKDNK